MTALFSLPSPLHPALVHFPIVLLLLGAIAAVAAAFISRWRTPLIAAVLLSLGAAGSVIAVQTGESDGELVNETPAIEAVLELHEEWAERTQIAAIVAALLAVGVVFATRWPVIATGLRVVTAVGAMAATWCVIQTGHYGGQLVYKYGAGVRTITASAGLHSAEQPAVKSKKHRDE